MWLNEAIWSYFNMDKSAIYIWFSVYESKICSWAHSLKPGLRASYGPEWPTAEKVSVYPSFYHSLWLVFIYRQLYCTLLGQVNPEGNLVKLEPSPQVHVLMICVIHVFHQWDACGIGTIIRIFILDQLYRKVIILLIKM